MTWRTNHNKLGRKEFSAFSKLLKADEEAECILCVVNLRGSSPVTYLFTPTPHMLPILDSRQGDQGIAVQPNYMQ